MNYVSSLLAVNSVLFFILAAIWKQDDKFNLAVKVLFVVLSFANMAAMILAIKAGV